MHLLQVKEFMNTRPLIFKEDSPLSSALDLIIGSKQIGGPVVNDLSKVVGVVTEKDLFQDLLKLTYHCQESRLIKDCMKTSFQFVGLYDGLMDVITKMEKFNAVIFPVIEDGELIGTIGRREVLLAIKKQLSDGCQTPV